MDLSCFQSYNTFKFTHILKPVIYLHQKYDKNPIICSFTIVIDQSRNDEIYYDKIQSPSPSEKTKRILPSSLTIQNIYSILNHKFKDFGLFINLRQLFYFD